MLAVLSCGSGLTGGRKPLSNIVELPGHGEDVLGSFTEQQVGEIKTQLLCSIQSHQRYVAGRDTDVSTLLYTVVHLEKKQDKKKSHMIQIMCRLKYMKHFSLLAKHERN